MQIRALRRDEIEPACDLLARAFWDDPLQMHLCPDPRSRYQRLRVLFRLDLAVMWPKGVIHTTDGLDGVAMWAAPRRWRTTPTDVCRSIIPVARSFGRRAGVALEAFRQMEAAHPRDPHWYLGTIGTDPGRSGRGVGTALIEAVTDRLDRDGEAAYLESSKFDNIAYYERFGFERLGDSVALRDGPTLYPMWRDPRPPA